MQKYFSDNEQEKAEFSSILSNAKNIIVTSHQNPDGDAFGSALGMLYYLQKITNAQVTYISPTEHAQYIAWMPGVTNIKVYNSSLDVQILSADLIFCLDFSASSRLKDMSKAVLNAACPKVVLDHHELPETWGKYYFWNQYASSSCELVYKFIETFGHLEHIDETIATCIYTGLLTDTGSFRFDATTPTVHKIVAHLLEKNVKPSDIHRKLFDQNNIERLKLLGFVFNQKMTYLPEFRTIYFQLSEEELKSFESKNGDTEGIVNYGLSVAGVAMAAIFIEKDGIIKISFRSIHDFSVAELARDHFSGGGHKNAAGGRSEINLEKTVEKFLTLLPNYKEKLLAQPN